jgi:hypothetical protein
MNKQELEQKLADLKSALAIAKPKMKLAIQQEIQSVESQLTFIESQNEATSNSTNATTQQNPDFLKTILATIAAQMTLGQGTGIDSPGVRAIIKEYLGKDKVQYNELDKSVIDEIKKNQLIDLWIPGYAEKIEADKSTTDIPNFWEIVDDVLAGNNVYLIGEAGGGKTYTAEQISSILGRKYVTLNCSQYTSPLEILGGQSVEGFKKGKLIDCWENGKILILDEMPKLDPNTAGLFNDALAKSSKTRTNEASKINSANADQPPIERNSNFGVIATGNIYPNEAPPSQYKGNNQQDLSLLDRFSGSVYYVEFSDAVDQKMCRYQFIYDFLIGNYYEYMRAKNNNQTLPPARGLRTVIESLNMKNLALVSYRTCTAFRVAFEYELVRAIAAHEGNNVQVIGKTFAKTFESYMVAFRSNRVTYQNLIAQTAYTTQYIDDKVETAIEGIIGNEDGFKNSLTKGVQDVAKAIYKSYKDFFMVAEKGMPKIS